MKNRLNCLLIAALWLFGTGYARGQTITGRKTVCYGSTWNYTYVAPPRAGVIYTWTLSGIYGTVTGAGASVNINWGHLGTIIFSCERDSAGVFIDRAFDTVTVVPMPTPYLVTTERIACQSFDTSKRVNPSPGPALLDDANGCPKLCSGSTATFIARGIGTDRHSWQFSGGNVFTSTDSSITVTFDTVTTTSTITLIDTSAGGCIVIKAVCIQKIKPPHPSFTVDSLSYSTSTYGVCKNAKVLFKNLTPSDSSSSITDYHWDFGDGNTSTLENPSHIYITPKPGYKATLTVTNECGCSAISAVTTITVNSNPGPKIYCPSVLCENDPATYSTDTVCTPGNYMWSVGSGGTILSTPPYGSSILVQWNGANADGYNTVSLWDNGCGTLCSEVTTVKIPLVQHSPVVTGMNNLFCTHHPYPISIPLWPGTEYNWGVIGHPNCVLSGRHTNAVALRFDTAGSYQVHVWFKNSLRLCGGDTTFTIQVNNAPVITGSHVVCSSPFGGSSYSLSGGFSGTWTITGPLPNPPQILYGSSCVPTFNIPGTYIITVAPTTGYPAFCSPDPYIVTVTQTPAAVDSVKGPTVVCSGLPYRYYAYSHEDGYIYKWVAKGGNIFDTPIGDSMTVHWVFATDTTVDTLQVYRVSLDSPYCSSTTAQLLVREKKYHPSFFTVPSDMCSDSYWYFDTHVPMDKDVKVRWTVMNTTATAPSNAGQVVNGADSTYATILWNHVSGLFAVRAIIQTCSLDTTIYADISVDTQAIVTLTVGNDTSCNGSLSDNFTVAGAGTGIYAWTWGDGTVDTTGYGIDQHTWNVPVNSGLVPMPVTVTSLSAGPGLCPGYAPGHITAYVRAPYTHVSTKNRIFYCDTATVFNDTLTVTANNTGTITGYTWVRNGSTISGSGSQIVVNDTGYYTVAIHTSACDFAADSVHITKGHCPSCSNSLGITESQNCNTVTATGFVIGGGHATAPQWTTTGGGVIAHPIDTTTTIAYNTAGYYYLTYYATVGGCNINITQLDSVPLVAKFNVTTSCTTPSYTYNFTDNSSKLPAWTIASVSWDIKTVGGTHIAGGTGTSYSYALPAGSYIVTETVTTGGAGVNTCTAIDTIIVTNAVALVTIHDSTITGCDQVPMHFRPIITPSTASVSSYFWSFGDGTGSLLSNPQKGYLFDGTPPRPTPNRDTVNLQVIDQFGCIYNASRVIDSTYPNTRGDGIINPYFSTCAGMADTLVADTHFSSVAVASYLWSDGTSASYDPVTVSGLYYLVVRDVHQCWDHTPYTGATILTRPDLSIRGRVSYCQGETVQLNCYRWPGYAYQWYRGTTAIPGGNYLYDNGLGAGSYAYRLVATDTTSFHCAPDTSAPDTVIIHPLPSKPVISSVNPINCPQYKLQVNCSTLAGYHYNWSNGGYGSADTITGGGALRVWCTDTFGCTNYTDTLIPYSPETWLAWFPTGCYNICQQAIRDSLNGPPGTFYSWQWLKNAATVSSGSNSLIRPLALTGTGIFYYQLGLANQYCVNPVLSDTMQATMQNCSGAPCGSLQSANLTCNASTPAGYNLTVNFLVAPTVGTILKIGLSTGPVLPFTIPYTGGPLPTMHFTTLTVPPPTKALVEVTFTNPVTGQTCYDTISVNVPYPCGWAAEKQTQQEEPQPISKTEQATGLVVYPNPAGQQLNVNYIYGTDKDVDRRIVIYDMKGRIIENRQVRDMNGTMNIQTGNFAAGMYILQMQENGKPLHTERVSIMH